MRQSLCSSFDFTLDFFAFARCLTISFTSKEQILKQILMLISNIKVVLWQTKLVTFHFTLYFRGSRLQFGVSLYLFFFKINAETYSLITAVETHPLSDKVTRLFLTLKFQFQFFLSVSSTLMLRDLVVR